MLEVLVTEGSVDLLVPALGVLSLQPQRLPRVIPQSVARSDRCCPKSGKGPATRRCRRAHPGRYRSIAARDSGTFARRWQFEVERLPIRIDNEMKKDPFLEFLLLMPRYVSGHSSRAG